jgi:hypothetical protein
VEKAGRGAGGELGTASVGNETRLVIHDPLVAQLFEKLADVGANLGGVGDGELRLQFVNDFGEGALTVATLQDLSPGALEFDCAFGEQDYALFGAGLGFCAPAATGG